MKKIKSLLGLSLISLLITGCNKTNIDTTSNKILIHVLNAEDYIDESLLNEFKDYIYENDHKFVEVIYDTYDTNETMYNTLKTGKTSYDAICTSDYMVQRLARENSLTKVNYDYLPNYSSYVTNYIVSINDDSGILNKVKINDDSNETLKDYAIGYMWGTLGILYNPEFILNSNPSLINNDSRFKGLTHDEQIEKIIELFESNDGYSLFWDPILNKTQSIKDSMRDTYALGIFEVYKDYFLNTRDDYETRSNKFNSSDNESITKVKNKLLELKDNIFGFEVDSGKNDIVTQKIGVNLAWSGDAVNSINRGYYADDDWEIPSDNPVNLYYSTPSIGANMWFDAWCLPKHEDSYYESEEYKYTLEFLDFLSNPNNALRNMSYNGYTSFISSNDNYLINDSSEEKDLSTSLLGYILYTYDLSEGIDDDNLDEYDEYDITSFFNFNEEFEIDLTYLSKEILLDEGEDIDSRIFKFEKDENGEVKIIIHTDLNSLEGRALKAQYPSSDKINNLYVMKDYGSQNDKILSMWEDVKVNPLPLWISISLITIIVLFLGYLGSYKLIRIYKLKKRKKLRELD